MAFWTDACCWVLSLRVGCILIALSLIVSETALFVISIMAGDKPMTSEDGMYTYAANMMYFPVVAFVLQIIAALCLIASTIWRKIYLAFICLGYQIFEGSVFIIIACDEMIGETGYLDEITLRVRGGQNYYFFQFTTICLRVYFLYIVASWIKELQNERNLAREEARAARELARIARNQARLAREEARQERERKQKK